MIRYFIIFFLFAFIPDAFTQQVNHELFRFYKNHPADTLPRKATLLVQADFSINSTAVPNQFLLTYAKGQFIDNELKDLVGDNLKKKNRFGYQFLSSVTGKYYKDTITSYMTGISVRQHNSALFSNDLFNLVFRGNKMYAGKIADLAPLNFVSFDYQSIFFGTEKAISEKGLTVWGGLSLIRGGTFRRVKADRALFYTEPDGAYLQADTKFNISLTPGQAGFISPSNGIGASVFMGADYRKGKSVIGISISDLGLISWNQLKRFSGDSIYRFEGKEIPNILAFDDNLYASYTGDSLAQEVGIKVSDKKKSYFLPTIIRVNYVYYASDKVFFVTGADLILNTGFIPRFYIKPVYQISKTVSTHATVATGGYGKLDFEFGAAAKLKNGFSGYLNLFAAEFLAAPSKSSGLGATIVIAKSF